jgi:hypothetical protein
MSGTPARRTTALTRTAKPCGPDTRCWCQVARRPSRPDRVGRAVNPPTTEARRIRLRGERGISRQAIAQGMPECFRLYLYARVRFATPFCTRDRGCGEHPAFPAPSLGEGGSCKPRAHRAARTRIHVHPSLRGAKRRSNPYLGSLRHGLLRGACHRARIRATRWLAMTGMGRGVLDAPPSGA